MGEKNSGMKFVVSTSGGISLHVLHTGDEEPEQLAKVCVGKCFDWSGFSWKANGHMCALYNTDGLLKLLDPRNYLTEKLHCQIDAGNFVGRLTFSPHSNWMVSYESPKKPKNEIQLNLTRGPSVESVEQGVLKLWNLESGKVVVNSQMTMIHENSWPLIQWSFDEKVCVRMVPEDGLVQVMYSAPGHLQGGAATGKSGSHADSPSTPSPDSETPESKCDFCAEEKSDQLFQARIPGVYRVILSPKSTYMVTLSKITSQIRKELRVTVFSCQATRMVFDHILENSADTILIDWTGGESGFLLRFTDPVDGSTQPPYFFDLNLLRIVALKLENPVSEIVFRPVLPTDTRCEQFVCIEDSRQPRTYYARFNSTAIWRTGVPSKDVLTVDVQLLKRMGNSSKDMIRWSPNGRYCLVVGTNIGHIDFWDIHTEKIIKPKREADQITSVEWSPSGSCVLVAFSGKQRGAGSGIRLGGRLSVFSVTGLILHSMNMDRMYKLISCSWVPIPCALFEDDTSPIIEEALRPHTEAVPPDLSKSKTRELIRSPSDVLTSKHVDEPVGLKPSQQEVLYHEVDHVDQSKKTLLIDYSDVAPEAPSRTDATKNVDPCIVRALLSGEMDIDQIPLNQRHLYRFHYRSRFRMSRRPTDLSDSLSDSRQVTEPESGTKSGEHATSPQLSNSVNRDNDPVSGKTRSHWYGSQSSATGVALHRRPSDADNGYTPIKWGSGERVSSRDSFDHASFNEAATDALNSIYSNADLADRRNPMTDPGSQILDSDSRSPKPGKNVASDVFLSRQSSDDSRMESYFKFETEEGSDDTLERFPPIEGSLDCFAPHSGKIQFTETLLNGEHLTGNDGASSVSFEDSHNDQNPLGRFETELPGSDATFVSTHSLPTNLITKKCMLVPSAQWYYIDHSGIPQGPFTRAMMRAWYQDGYLSRDLPVRITSNEIFNFVKLWDLFTDDPCYERCREPFADQMIVPVNWINAMRIHVTGKHKPDA